MACAPAPIYQPLSVAELQDDVRAVVSSGLKVKPAGTSHSATSIICGDGNSAVIRSTHLTGIEINQLQEHLAGQGYSHGFGATGFGGISVAEQVAYCRGGV